MLFNSYAFILLFLPATFVVYFWLNAARYTTAGHAWLVACSLFFYGWWNPAYVPILAGSIVFNYSVGRYLTVSRLEKVRRVCLSLGIAANLALLGYFKYADFLIANVQLALGTELQQLGLVLPLAISFFTFQQIAYLVDSYRRECKEYSFLRYAVFVSFFPQLIAGPIVHHAEMMPQFASARAKLIKYSNVACGLFIFSVGLFKKVVIADTFAIWAIKGFDESISLNLIEAWSTSLSYTFQLYFDFSGYSDMAIGLALMFNIRLPINFYSPYKASNIQEFWRRWHITLSRFLRDYIYIPMGGSQAGEMRLYTNLAITFLLGGIWHGAGWTFVFWGALHGLAVILHRAWSQVGVQLWPWLAWLLTFNFVNIAWVFFRAKSWEDAVKVLAGMCGFGGVRLPEWLAGPLASASFIGVEFGSVGVHENTLGWIIAGFVITVLLPNSMQMMKAFRPTYIVLAFAMGLFFVSLSKLNEFSEFLYFNF